MKVSNDAMTVTELIDFFLPPNHPLVSYQRTKYHYYP
jgi:hypothetical protein